MKIDNSSRNNINFTSVVPLKVLIDNAPATHEFQVHNVVKKTSDIIHYGLRGDKDSINNILTPFYLHDSAFAGQNGIFNNKTPIKVLVENGTAYLFTGLHAKVISELGSELGIAKNTLKRTMDEYTPMSKSLSQREIDEIEVLGELQKAYVSAKKKFVHTINKFILEPNIRLREGFDFATGKKLGEEVDLVIHAKRNPQNGKYSIKHATFEKKGEVSEQFFIAKPKKSGTGSRKSANSQIKSNSVKYSTVKKPINKGSDDATQMSLLF